MGSPLIEAHTQLGAPLPFRLRGTGPYRAVEPAQEPALYDDLLDGWRSLELQIMNQGGVRTEKLCFNFAIDRLHWASYAGRNFTDRQRSKRKAANCSKPC